MSLRLLLLVALAGAAQATQVDTGRVSVVEDLPAGMVVVPGGTFIMGIDLLEINDLRGICRQEHGATTPFCDKEELFIRFIGRAREVYVSSFAIDRHEVTVSDYRACVATGACERLPLVSGDTRALRDELPMANTTWDEADSYCRWQGKRLPTEAEWEKAARGVDGRRWPWGMIDGDGRANRGRVAPPVLWRYDWQFQGPVPDYVPDDVDGAGGPMPPGSFPWGRSPYGVDDMAGNVSEWVQDWSGDAGYAGLSPINPMNGTPGRQNHWRVVRGGAFDEPHYLARTYVRNAADPEWRSPSRGFRCARDVL